MQKKNRYAISRPTNLTKKSYEESYDTFVEDQMFSKLSILKIRPAIMYIIST